MQITIKNLKQCEGRDGVAFSATIYVDGEKAGVVTNSGTGGCNFYSWLNREKGRQVEAFAASEFPEECESMDWMILKAMDRFDMMKTVRKNFRKGFRFTLLIKNGEDKDEPGIFADQFTVGYQNESQLAQLLALHKPEAYEVIDGSAA